MKKSLKFIISVFLVLGLCSCSGADSKKDEKADAESQEHPAVLVIQKYVKALVEYDVETQKECMDPSVNSFSDGLVDTVGDFLGLSDASGMADGAMGLLCSGFEMSTGYEIDCKFVKVLENNLSEKNGDITVQYKLIVTDENSGDEYETEFSWRFNMVCKDSKWYILSYDEPGEVSQEQADSLENGEGVNPDNTVGGKATRYVDAYHFSGGYAIVHIAEESSSGIYPETRAACIDTQGIIQFFFPEGFTCTMTDRMSFFNGVCMLYGGYGTQKVMTNTGKELYTFESTSATDISETGYTVIPVTTSTYQGTTTEYGLMNNKGEWVFEPDEKYWFSYRWDGFFDVTEYLEDGSAKSYYYDTNTDKIIEGSSGEIAPYEYHEGLYYNDKKFFDIDGNVAIDLSDYADISYVKGFINGRACVEANGFTVIIDKDGNMLCDPIEGRPSGDCGYNMKYSDCISVERGGVIYYYDMDGNFLFECNGLNNDFYSDGLLLESDGTYIDKTGAEIIKSEIDY